MSGEITSPYLTRSKFAELRGWSPSYVTKLGQQQRLILSPDGKLIDVSATIALLDKTSDPAKDVLREHHAAARTEKHVGIHTRHDAPSDEKGAGASADPKYWDNKTKREGALAELAELELAKKRGDLVERERVEAMAFGAGRMLRDAVLGLPTRIAPELATMTDPFQVEVKLREALRQVFAEQSKMTADDLSKAMEPSH